MKICHVLGYYHPKFLGNRQNGRELLQQNLLTYHLPVELARLGHEVTVLQLFHRDEILEEAGVRFEFLQPNFFSANLGKFAALFFRQYGFPYFQLGQPMIDRLQAFKPHLIHYFGLTMTPNLWLFSRWAKKRDVPFIVHYHGGAPAHHRLVRRLEKKSLQRINGALFTNREQARPWLAAGLRGQKVRQILETSSSFFREDRTEALRKTGLWGCPIFVSAARLHPMKDPWTVLNGFEKIVEAWPKARLYFFYQTDELLDELKKAVIRNTTLAQAVSFRGQVPHSHMQAVFSSADFLLQASRRECSGCAVLEAMACGTIPVLSNIPAFQTMTDNGRYGLLFQPGNPSALASQVLQLTEGEIDTLSQKVRKNFLRELSFPALARKAEDVYQEFDSRDKP